MLISFLYQKSVLLSGNCFCIIPFLSFLRASSERLYLWTKNDSDPEGFPTSYSSERSISPTQANHQSQTNPPPSSIRTLWANLDNVNTTNCQVYKSLLSEWYWFAEQGGIEYMLSCGSLSLGQYINKKPILWDWDVDINLSYRYLSVFNAYSNKQDFRPGQDDKLRLITHPEFGNRTQNRRRRFSCQGKVFFPKLKG